MRNMLILGLIIALMACSPTPSTDTESNGQDSAMLADTLVIETSEPVSHFEFVRAKNKYPQNYFRNPFDSAILLSGTYCELRNNHFHGGLDIRTGGYQGWSVKSVADGYVSRIKVSPYGYGNALYIKHSNGYTSVYGHLKEFSGAIANYVKEAQYNKRSFEIELYPKAGALKVSKGQQVALSGNTGGSGGPHLHFEIRNPAGLAVNPLLFGLDVKDHIPPQIRQVLVFHKDKEILYSQGGYPMKKLKKGTSYLKGAILKLKPGTYGFGMLSKDFFTDTRYRLGINYAWLTANDQLLYQYQIETMDFTKGRYINTHMEYYLKAKTGVNYVRLFKEPFNPYPYYKQKTNGEVFIQQGDTVRLQLFVEDYAGMRDSVSWTIVGDSLGQKIHWLAKHASDTTVRIRKGRTNTVKHDNWTITLPNSTFYHDFDLKLRDKSKRAGLLSQSLQMHYNYTPLHSYISVRYGLSKAQLAYGNKLCAVSFSGDHKVYEGGTINGNFLNFKTRSFGEYAIYIDTIPPRIRTESIGRKFRFRVSDNLSGIKSYTASIDDKWILMQYEPKLNLMWGEIPAWIKEGKHQFKIVVIDDKGNKSQVERTITL